MLYVCICIYTCVCHPVKKLESGITDKCNCVNILSYSLIKYGYT